MGVLLQKNRSVKLVVDGMDELDVRLDDLESKFEDLLVVIKALSKEVSDLKKPVKKAAAKKPTKKK